MARRSNAPYWIKAHYGGKCSNPKCGWWVSLDSHRPGSLRFGTCRAFHSKFWSRVQNGVQHD